MDGGLALRAHALWLRSRLCSGCGATHLPMGPSICAAGRKSERLQCENRDTQHKQEREQGLREWDSFVVSKLRGETD